MGTRGYLAYRFRGRYYVRYNSFDSYPQHPGIGSKLVNDIPVDPEEYQKWFQKLHDELVSWENILTTKVLAILESRIDLLSLFSGKSYMEPRYKAYLDERLEWTPSFALPFNEE